MTKTTLDQRKLLRIRGILHNKKRSQFAKKDTTIYKMYAPNKSISKYKR